MVSDPKKISNTQAYYFSGGKSLKMETLSYTGKKGINAGAIFSTRLIELGPVLFGQIICLLNWNLFVVRIIYLTRNHCYY